MRAYSGDFTFKNPSEAAAYLFDNFASTIPVKPEQIAMDLGYKVAPLTRANIETANIKDVSDSELASISGLAAINESGKKFIFYSPTDHMERQRFTIAHELGHHVLHSETLLKSKLKRDTNFISQNKEEIDANRFAAELLLPFKYLKMAILEADNIDTKHLAKKFCVSDAVMTIRLINLGILKRANDRSK